MSLLKGPWGSAPGAGLVIRANRVELLALQGTRVAAQASVPIEGQQDLHLTAAIRRALETANLKTKRVAVSVLTQDVLFRFFTMPVVPRYEWEHAVQFEVRKHIPFKIETLVWDFHVAPSAAPNKLEVIFAAIQREDLHRVQASLASLGLSPTVIEPRSLSLARLTSADHGQGAGECVGIVDIEEETAHLVIAKGGLPYLARDVSLRSSATSLPVPPQTAAAVAAPAEPPVVPAQASEGHLQRLLSELRVSVDFFTREYALAGVKRVWLFGEERQVAPWCEPLAEQLRCPVQLGTTLLAQQVGGGLPLTFASAVGLLHAGRTRTSASIDFLSRSLVKRSSERVKSAAFNVKAVVAALKTPRAVAFMSGLVGLVVAAWLLGARQVQEARQRLHQVVHASLPDGFERLSAADVEKLTTQAQAQLTLVKQLVGRRTRLAAKLDALVRSLPDGVWLTAVTFEETPDASGKGPLRLLVRGACHLHGGGEITAIQEFQDHIKDNPALFKGFSAARLGEIAVQRDAQHNESYLTFLLDCTSDRSL